MHFLSMSTWTNFFIAAIPIALSAPNLVSRKSVDLAPITTVNATVLDHAGHDITPSFQIRLFYPASSPNLITNTSLSNRQVSYARPLNYCSKDGIFMESFCTPEHNKAGSLQSYTIICHHLVPAPDPAEFSDPLLADFIPIGFIPNQQIQSRQRDGHCADDEICVPGLGAGRSRSGRRMASCVRTEYFIHYVTWGSNHRQNLTLNGMRASMVASQLDGTTPVEVEKFEVDIETINNNNLQKKTCRDCVELETDKFGATTEGLKVGTTLLTTGAMAGVLWLAIMSG